MNEKVQAILGWMANNPEQVIYLVGLMSGLMAWMQRLAVAKHADRLGMLRAAARAAVGRIVVEAVNRPRGELLDAFVARRIREEARAVVKEFSTTAPKVSATANKLTDMIIGEMGLNPVALAQGLKVPDRMAVLVMGERT